MIIKSRWPLHQHTHTHTHTHTPGKVPTSSKNSPSSSLSSFLPEALEWCPDMRSETLWKVIQPGTNGLERKGEERKGRKRRENEHQC